MCERQTITLNAAEKGFYCNRSRMLSLTHGIFLNETAPVRRESAGSDKPSRTCRQSWEMRSIFSNSFLLMREFLLLNQAVVIMRLQLRVAYETMEYASPTS